MSEDAHSSRMPEWGTPEWRTFLLIAVCKKPTHRSKAECMAIEIYGERGIGPMRDLIAEWGLK
jgi:hypothetical protein